MIRRVAFASMVVGLLAHPASAQVYPTPQAPPIPANADVPPPPPKPVAATLPEASPKLAQAAKPATARASPATRRVSTSDAIARRDSQSGQGRFENPGGVGRYAEYYTANTPTSQLDLHAIPRTHFDQGGGPDRASQIASFRAGQQRTANIQNNINAYGRPYGAYGAGFGFGFGAGYGLYGGGFR